MALLRSESPSGKCTKLHTVTASNNRDHSIISCSRRIYTGVILRAHPLRGESHIQRDANREVATALALKQEWRSVYFAYAVHCRLCRWCVKNCFPPGSTCTSKPASLKLSETTTWSFQTPSTCCRRFVRFLCILPLCFWIIWILYQNATANLLPLTNHSTLGQHWCITRCTTFTS